MIIKSFYCFFHYALIFPLFILVKPVAAESATPALRHDIGQQQSNDVRHPISLALPAGAEHQATLQPPSANGKQLQAASRAQGGKQAERLPGLDQSVSRLPALK